MPQWYGALFLGITFQELKRTNSNSNGGIDQGPFPNCDDSQGGVS
jgi:hypothetical protein